MRKSLLNIMRVAILLVLALIFIPQKGYSQAAPEKYEGVMLQAFFWDSQKETSWSALNSQADEIAKSFGLVWLPPSGNDLMGHMGYHPVYFFNQNSAFGTQNQLKTLISNLKAKGCLSIADIVVNHRNGVTNWTDFPAETYKGITYVWGPETICKDDEVAYQAGQPKPTGNWDTGEGWSGARDIDHTNQHVRNTIKAYLDFMKNEMGYSGWRYDVAKGYSAYYMGEYSRSSGCEFSVGEYWDSSYDALTRYIDGTKIDNQINTGAFDFALKSLLNEACNNGAWDKLVWKRYGTLEQPAGLIHSDGFARFAYTFVDNHDTWRPGTSAHGAAVVRNELAANAFIIAHPGIPCVFYPHWRDFKAAIKPMIEARNKVGIHNQSEVKVLETGRDIYAAEVFGKKGSLVVKVGPKYSFNVPQGYILACSGENYAIWTKINNTTNPDPVDPQEPTGNIVIKWKNDQNWQGDMRVYAWDSTGELAGKWPGKTVAADANGTYTFATDKSSFNVIFNSNNAQTIDVTNITASSCFTITTEKDSKNLYNVVPKECENNGGPITIKWKNDLNWGGNINIYAWTKTGEVAGRWPGSKAQVGNDGYYYYNFSQSPVNFIINNGVYQTVNIENITANSTYTILDKKFNNKNYQVKLAAFPATYFMFMPVVSYDEVRVNVYPNPATDIINISGVENITEVNIVNRNGVSVKRVINPSSGINVSDLLSGIYFINIKANNQGYQNIRFIKR